MENNEDMLNILLSAMSNMSDKDSEDKEQTENTDEESSFSGINLDMIMKIGDIMSKLNTKDKNTELLIALKPYLREENQKKIDSAVKLFRIITLLPLLRDTGLFENLF